MSTRRESRLNNLLDEIRQLKERMSRLLPAYVSALKGISALPEEFEGRFWASHAEALLQRVKADYDVLQAKVQKMEFIAQFTAMGIGMILKARGIEPLPPPAQLQVGVTLSPSGEIKPDCIGNQQREPEVVFVTYDQFVATVREFIDQLLAGTIVPTTEDDSPRLIYEMVSHSP